VAIPWLPFARSIGTTIVWTGVPLVAVPAKTLNVTVPPTSTRPLHVFCWPIDAQNRLLIVMVPVSAG
jgi:hypothetical protein